MVENLQQSLTKPLMFVCFHINDQGTELFLCSMLVHRQQLFFGDTEAELGKDDVHFTLPAEFQQDHVRAIVTDDLGNFEVTLTNEDNRHIELTRTNVIVLDRRQVFGQNEVIPNDEMVQILVKIIQLWCVTETLFDDDLVAHTRNPFIEWFVCVTCYYVDCRKRTTISATELMHEIDEEVCFA